MREIYADVVFVVLTRYWTNKDISDADLKRELLKTALNIIEYQAKFDQGIIVGCSQSNLIDSNIEKFHSEVYEMILKFKE